MKHCSRHSQGFPPVIGYCLATVCIFLLCRAPLSDAESLPTTESSSFVYGDLRPDAPVLAVRGPYSVGVQTIDLVNKDQIDVNSTTATNPAPHYDRPVILEVWYPAVVPNGKAEQTTYTDYLSPSPDRTLPVAYNFSGRALRGAVLDRKGGPYPLIVVSHGYPGSRVMMSYLAENLASKGYIVAAIDHADSTHIDKGAFASTLVNRWADITFVLDQFELATHRRLAGPLAFVGSYVNVQQTALVGYSMGGYGVLNVGGAGYSDRIQSLVGGRLTGRLSSSPTFAADKRVRAIVAFAPWGGAVGAWDAAGLAGLKVPILFVDGDHDDVAGYSPGVRTIFEESINSDRYLLVYENARHNIAPNPPPPAANVDLKDFLGYGEPVWNSERINNINQHFVTAFLNQYLRGSDESQYLNIPVHPGADDWNGFAARTALGLEFWHLTPGHTGSSAEVRLDDPELSK